MHRRIASSLVVTAAVLLAGAVWAQQKAHTTGTVTAIDAKHIEIKPNEGRETVTAVLDKDTKFQKGGEAATLADVQKGMRVVVHIRVEGRSLIVEEVHIGGEQAKEVKEKETKKEEDPPEPQH